MTIPASITVQALLQAKKTLARAEAARTDMLAMLLRQDERLVDKGWPPLSPFWREAFEKLYERKARRLVARVGRRGGKSSSGCRLAVAEALHGGHPVPPGDIGIYGIISVKRSDAEERLRTIGAILAALEVPHLPGVGEIVLTERPIAFRAYAANYRTVVGGTWIGALFDELARWRDEESGANPATEILRSARPTMATMRGAKELMLSSPWSTLDAHYDAIELGDAPEQVAAQAPTWVANPTLTEKDCRALEPDEATFDREYGAVPMASREQQFFDGRALIDAQEVYPLPRLALTGDVITAGADMAFRRDSSALVVVHRTPTAGAEDVGGGILRVAEMLELRPSARDALRPSKVVADMAAVMRRHDIDTMMADAHYREAIIEHLSHERMHLADAPAGASGKSQSYVYARQLLHQGRLRLPKHKGLIRDLSEVTAKPTAGGLLSVKLPEHAGGGHADLVSALVLACWQRAGVVQAERLGAEQMSAAELDMLSRSERAYGPAAEDDDSAGPNYEADAFANGANAFVL